MLTKSTSAYGKLCCTQIHPRKQEYLIPPTKEHYHVPATSFNIPSKPFTSCLSTKSCVLHKGLKSGKKLNMGLKSILFSCYLTCQLWGKESHPHSPGTAWSSPQCPEGRRQAVLCCWWGSWPEPPGRPLKKRRSKSHSLLGFWKLYKRQKVRLSGDVYWSGMVQTWRKTQCRVL